MPHLPDHQTHDPLLVAAFAAGDAEGSDLVRAQALVATCDACADLHADLRAIAAALPATPAPVRTRDFRLTPEQAHSIRPAGWRRLLAPLAGPRFAFAAPLGGSLAALGIAGILVAGAAGTPLMGAGAEVREGAPPAAVGTDGVDPTEVQRLDGLSAPGGSAAPAEVPAPAPQATRPANAHGDRVTAGNDPDASAQPYDATAAGPDGSPDGSSDDGEARPGAGSKDGSGAGSAGQPGVGVAGSEADLATAAATSASPLAIAATLLVAVGAILLLVRIVARRLA